MNLGQYVTRSLDMLTMAKTIQKGKEKGFRLDVRIVPIQIAKIAIKNVFGLRTLGNMEK